MLTTVVRSIIVREEQRGNEGTRRKRRGKKEEGEGSEKEQKCGASGEGADLACEGWWCRHVWGKEATIYTTLTSTRKEQ